MPTQDDEVAEVCFDGPGKSGTKICATCGNTLDPGDRHPAAVAVEETPRVYLFCSASCRETWIGE